MLAQYVFETLFEGIVKTKAITDNHHAEAYVVRKLKGKFHRICHPHKEDFIFCLNQIAVIEDGDVSRDTCVDYTKRWI